MKLNRRGWRVAASYVGANNDCYDFALDAGVALDDFLHMESRREVILFRATLWCLCMHRQDRLRSDHH
jgi:hypothetical protein